MQVYGSIRGCKAVDLVIEVQAICCICVAHHCCPSTSPTMATSLATIVNTGPWLVFSFRSASFDKERQRVPCPQTTSFWLVGIPTEIPYRAPDMASLLG
jgi:hypothetical protein